MAILSIGASANSVRPVSPDPSSLEWGLQDVSGSDAGRVMDLTATMYKQRLCQKRKLKCTWAQPTAAQVAAILQAVNPEYIYVGDRSAPLQYVWVSGTRYKTLSFDLIER